MNVAAALLLYSLVVLLIGPPFLRQLTRSGHAPRWGVATWLTAIASVLITWLLAAVLLVLDVAGYWYQDAFVVPCLTILQGILAGEAGVAAQVGVMAFGTAAALAVSTIGIRLVRTLSRFRARTREHAQAVRFVGQATAENDVVVVDAPEPAAYCVSGRPPAIVVTTAAVAALDEHQLRAVLAHERAHLAGRHTNVVGALRSLATVFPRLPLMADGASEVSRLLEMCADDAATRTEDRSALLAGLLALVGAAPSQALGAADVAVLARAKRLAAPPTGGTRARTRVLLTSTVMIMVVGPIAAAVLTVSRALMCGP